MFQLPDDDDDDFWKEMPLDDRTLSRITTGKENEVQQHNLPPHRSASCKDVLSSDDRYGVTSFPVNLQSTSSCGVATSENKHSGYAETTPRSLNLQTSTGRLPPVRPTSGNETLQTPPRATGCSSVNVLNDESAPYSRPFNTAGTRACAGTPITRGDRNLGNSRTPASAITPSVVGDQGMTDVRISACITTPTLRDTGNMRFPAPSKHMPTTGCDRRSDERSSSHNVATPITGCDRQRSSSHNVVTPSIESDGGTSGEYVTPRRKRKFPGPAGILPQLGPGQSLDKLNAVVTPTTTFKKQKSPQDDAVLLSSQSTESMFSDVTWLQLLSDLGEDGHKLLNKFSIAATLLNAGKKQLAQGKAPMLFGMIEAIESHGSEARVTIRDRSGRMEGTVHRDLLKEYERELQVGTVLVLKQVSILSLSARKHYVNITPSNMLMVYDQNCQDGLRSLPFHGSQDSLSSVLKALESRAGHPGSCGSSSEPSTPGSGTGSSRLSGVGSSTGTPQLGCGASPLASPRFSDGPGIELRTPVRGVRDVSVVTNMNTPSGRLGQITTNYSRLNSEDMPPRFIHQLSSNNSFKTRESNSAVVASRLSSFDAHSNNNTGSDTPKQIFMDTRVSGEAIASEKSSMQSMVRHTNIVDERAGANVSNADRQLPNSPTTPSTRGRWRFKPRTPVISDTLPTTPTPYSGGRSCQIGGNTDTVPSNTNVAAGRVATRSQLNPTGVGRSGLDSGASNFRCDTGEPRTAGDKQAAVNRVSVVQSVNQKEDQDLWGDGMDDDLTDEILSQL